MVDDCDGIVTGCVKGCERIDLTLRAFEGDLALLLVAVSDPLEPRLSGQPLGQRMVQEGVSVRGSRGGRSVSFYPCFLVPLFFFAPLLPRCCPGGCPARCPDVAPLLLLTVLINAVIANSYDALTLPRIVAGRCPAICPVF